MKKRIIGYWCPECERRDRRSFFFKRVGYCDCLEESGHSAEELGYGEDGCLFWGHKKSTMSKLHKTWKPVFIEEK